MKLKYFKYILVGFITVLFACNKEQILVPTNTDWDGTEFPISGGLLEITNSSLPYVVGNTGPYNIEMRVLQGSSNLTTKIDVYVIFHHTDIIKASDGSDSIVTPHVSDKKLLATLDQSGKTVTHFDTLTFNYSDLTALGLTLDDGSSVPAQDTSLTIGDYFQFIFMSTVEDGHTYQNSKQAVATVSGRYAGQWHVSYANYWRIGVDNSPIWGGQDITLESVDATTYHYTDWGAYVGFGDELFFKVDPATLIVSYPDGQVLNGQPLITLQSNYTDFSGNIIPQAASLGFPESVLNTVINDDVNGQDRIILMYGYYTAGSGPRTFFEVLDKIVE